MKTNKIIAVLKAEKRGLCTDELCEFSGKQRISCFWGALLWAIGYRKKQIERLDVGLSTTPWSDEYGWNRLARQDLMKHYGVTDQDITDLMGLNDELNSYYFEEFTEDEQWIEITPIERRDVIIETLRAAKL